MCLEPDDLDGLVVVATAKDNDVVVVDRERPDVGQMGLEYFILNQYSGFLHLNYTFNGGASLYHSQRLIHIIIMTQFSQSDLAMQENLQLKDRISML